MKAIVKMPCEDGSCKHNHEMLIDTEELGIKVNDKAPPQATVTKVSEIERTVDTHDHTHSHEPKPDEHKELADTLPKGVNFAYCTGPDCGKKITNSKGIVTKFKTCKNCGANTVPKSKSYCPTCGNKEDKEEPFDESEVSLEVEDED